MSGARRDPGKIRGKGSAGARSGQSLRVSTHNALFQQWQALLSNRTKRQRSGEFLIHGVRPITLAVERGWPLRNLLYPSGRKLSSWASRLIDECAVKTVEVHPDLLRELGERESEPPELIAVAELRPDDLDRVPVEQDFLGVVFDRPTSPGNIGTLVRSADAFGADGLIVSGHAADVYDPKSVRASTGSLFSVPAVRVPSPRSVLDWVTEHRRREVPIAVVGTDENGTSEITECDLTRPVLLVIGNETTGMSTTWQEMCDEVVRVPIGGAASSLNAASAGTVLLYEAARQRGFPVA
ncbi:TrmH family RNA methyltransferase [Saccharopolyspora sp. ASAGF58]|uniref:TrmH family RNA methyltransferase n=1 Tax=Saccharopolyspora sp. ASAGF58 TaxID=2719023 RepID=UPI001FF0CFC1|nr:TrmH family RNA methyltransferase [Saccharopolyspora sp. ASAGF58]